MGLEKMNPEIKKMWVDALESGEYKQSNNELRNSLGFCCLGVLCDLHEKATGKHFWNLDMWNDFRYFGESGILPIEVIQWSGVQDFNPSIEYEGEERDLAGLNDDARLSFKQIAAIIKEQL